MFLSPAGRPCDVASMQDLSALVREKVSRGDCSAIIQAEAVCVSDSKPEVGRIVGGIGNFSYMVELRATFQETAYYLTETSPVSSPNWTCLTGLALSEYRYSEPVLSRFGSRSGVADAAERQGAEEACAARAQELLLQMKDALAGVRNVEFRG